MADQTTERAPVQTRTLTFDVDIGARAADDGGIPVVVSSDAVVQASDGPEVLVHTADAIDLSRAPLPIIATHRSNQINVGVIEDLQISGGRLRGVARFGSRPEAAGYREDVVRRIIRSISAGYSRVKGYVRNDGVLITTRWMPTHAAMVAEPADVNAGFYRAAGFDLTHEDDSPAHAGEGAAAPTAATARAATQTGEIRMSAQETGAATATAENAAVQQDAARLSAREAEVNRISAVRNLCRANRIDARTEQRWITDGTPLETVATEMLDVMEERGRQNPAVEAEIGLSRNDTARYSVFRAIRALAWGAQHPQYIAEAAFERECSAAVAKKIGRESRGILIPSEILMRPVGRSAAEHAQQRAMAVVPGSKGGFMVNTENLGFIDILRNRQVTRAMGARVLSGLQGNITIPRQTGKATVTWQAGEHVSVTASDQALGQLSATPKTCIAITDVSEQLLRQATPSAEGFIMADLAADVAIDGIDAAAINGTGGAQPLGIKNTTGITSGQDASTATYAKILAFPGAAAAVNAIRGNPGFVTNVAGAIVLMQKQRFSSTDTPVWEGNMMDGTLVGFRAMSSEQIASGNLVFGSWDELVICEWGVLELATDMGGTRFNTATVGIRAMWMVDVILRYPQAFVVSTNLSA
jgi:HK97 family phage major capsid protein